MRTSNRGDSVKQSENSAIQEHVTEASLISLLGRGRLEGEVGKVEMFVFPCAPQDGSETVGGQGVGRMTARGVLEGFKNERRP